MIPQVCATNSAKSEKVETKKMSTLGKVVTGTVVTLVGVPTLCFIGDKVSYECFKSENGIDMRGITKRGYYNRGVLADSLSSHRERYNYLINKWTRAWTPWKSFEFRHNMVEITFARSLPTVKDLSFLTDYDIFKGRPPEMSSYGPHLDRQEVLETFAKNGILDCFDDMVIVAGYDSGYLPHDRNYCTADGLYSDKILQYVHEALLPLFLSSAPDEKYFKIYYHWNGDVSLSELVPYERFDYNRWAQDVFHVDFRTVVRKHHEAFLHNGAVFNEQSFKWDLRAMDLAGAEREIDAWRSQQQQSAN